PAGRIVTIGSVTSAFGDAGLVAYGTSKHAVLGMTRALAGELGPRGVTANCVMPSAIDTPMTAPAFAAMPEYRTHWEQKSALGRLGQPEDIADVIAFLLSPQSRAINGAGVPVVSTVDRGMLALVVDPVRRDLAIGEVDIALLQGFAFAVFYVSVGLPLGYVADRVNRRRLLFGGILVWSAGTIACGLAQTFAQMFLARLVIGVGEAVLGPCAVGMIGEMFAPDRRGRPMALYVLGSMVAYGLGSMATGAVLQAGAAGGFA
ncbi:hypothetical protein E4T56_gene10394, partial [Termitomyces sp. T112]